MRRSLTLWVRSPHGLLHRKRDYTRTGGRTLCGWHVLTTWLPAAATARGKCKRCAA